jgi:hypothetical protein
MPNTSVQAAVEGVPAGNVMEQLALLLRKGDAQGALALIETSWGAEDSVVLQQKTDSEAMPSSPSPEYYAAWQKCRGLGRQLATALKELNAHGDNVYAWILPDGEQINVAFGEMDRLSPETLPLPVDRVEKLSIQLSHALDDWREHTHVPFMAYVPPASLGCGFHYQIMQQDLGLPTRSDAVIQLYEILGKASRIIRNSPELQIERISINEHGAQTFRKIEGASLIDGSETMSKTVSALYADWQEQYQIANKSGLSEEERNLAVDRIYHIATAMISVPPASVVEYAMKLDACTEHGAFPLRKELIDEVISIAKCRPCNDPLMDTIEAYRAGLREMNAIPIDDVTFENEDELVAKTYGEPMNRLLQWDQPALTKEGAIEALKLMDEQNVFTDRVGETMRLAVLRFLEAL